MIQKIPEIDPENSSNKFSEYFKFVSILGTGAFGIVVAAEDKKLGNSVYAVKIMRKNSLKVNFVDGLRKEADILAQFKHPNIVSFKRIIETETQFFLVMECLYGGHLKQLMEHRVDNKHKFTEEEASTILQKIALALEYIHGKDIVHRDLKPENILFADANDLATIRIVDFGLSVQYETEISQSFSQQCGTKIYMAPELFNKMEYSKPVDIWSLGIIMYQLLNNGKHPLYQPNDNLEAYTAKIQAREIPPLQCSELANHLLTKLLAFDSHERYSAVEVLQHPWITRRLSDKIPLTLNDRMKAFYNKQTILRVIKTIGFVRNLQRLQKTAIKPLEDIHEERPSVDSLTNFVIESAEHSEQSEVRQSKVLASNNSVGFTGTNHNRQTSIKSERNTNNHLAVPQFFEDLLPGVRLKTKVEPVFFLNGQEAGPIFSRSKTSETDDLRSTIQFNLKTKTKSPALSEKESNSPDVIDYNSGERSSHNDKNIESDKSVKRTKFSNFANQMLQPTDSNAASYYSKRHSDLLKETPGFGLTPKPEHQKILQERNKVNDEYRIEDLKPSNMRNTHEIRILKPEEKDILTNLVGTTRKRGNVAQSPEPTGKIFKAFSDVPTFRNGKNAGYELKVAEDPQDPNIYSPIDPKNIRGQSSANNLNVRKLTDDLLNVGTPYKKNASIGVFKHAKTPNGREGRHSSTPKSPTPKSPKDSKAKQQIQTAGDMAVYLKSTSQDFPATGRIPPPKSSQKFNFNEPPNSKKQPEVKNYKMFK